MKRDSIFLTVIVLVCGCTNPYSEYHNQIEAISEFVQTIDANTVADLDFKLLEIEHERDITAADSIPELHAILRVDAYNYAEDFLEIFDYDHEQIGPMLRANMRYAETGEVDLDSISVSDFMAKWRLRRYIAKPDSSFGGIYRAKYEIDNPILSVRQTVNARFLISPDYKNVVRRID